MIVQADAQINRELTARETEIATALLAGESAKEIAARLWLSHETVKTHIRHILAKMGYPSVWQMRLSEAVAHRDAEKDSGQADGDGVGIEIIVPGEPIPKQSFRIGYRGRHFQPARIRAAQDQVAWCAREAMAGEPPLTGPVEVIATFARKSRRPCDIDNMFKLVADALEGIVYKNDAQIVHLELDKVQVDRLDGARTTIRAKALGG